MDCTTLFFSWNHNHNTNLRLRRFVTMHHVFADGKNPFIAARSPVLNQLQSNVYERWCRSMWTIGSNSSAESIKTKISQNDLYLRLRQRIQSSADQWPQNKIQSLYSCSSLSFVLISNYIFPTLSTLFELKCRLKRIRNQTEKILDQNQSLIDVIVAIARPSRKIAKHQLMQRARIRICLFGHLKMLYIGVVLLSVIVGCDVLCAMCQYLNGIYCIQTAQSRTICIHTVCTERKQTQSPHRERTPYGYINTFLSILRCTQNRTPLYYSLQ